MLLSTWMHTYKEKKRRIIVLGLETLKQRNGQASTGPRLTDAQ